MCTAVAYNAEHLYFGRNLDRELSYGESITIMPRSYPIKLRSGKTLSEHYAMIGMALCDIPHTGGFPLYYDAANEVGLCIAGLSFEKNAVYQKKSLECDNIASFELIPFLLAKCGSVAEAVELIAKINITDEAFSRELSPSQLHWLLADRTECIVLEATLEGIKLYNDPVGVLTNNPPFPTQLFMLNNYLNISPKPPLDRSGLPLSAYSRGMGGLGLPGDLSSASRFVRAAFVRANSYLPENAGEDEKVAQFFHILSSVEQPRGCCELDDGSHEYTLYSSCINADRSIYYCKTYYSNCVSAISMSDVPICGDRIITYPIFTKI